MKATIMVCASVYCEMGSVCYFIWRESWTLKSMLKMLNRTPQQGTGR
eukprot:CAMPEP_0174362528 /NCGR_PEP_ID=MMETSP0811_2-20130205/64752_1 /TAXON_ID=73025 ORGANISM="Eutreptiella gymnastica-like, Strain CCMP1594" /NCGR_SAMPLE_ID=MMETSP0811_2 /ASSEMBLY_ACC=CAM_ASM_000667 /LENGTH=46 /DNA_ID= /DNA_START= /DNA_END= /DNA_ORIENTATION=